MKKLVYILLFLLTSKLSLSMLANAESNAIAETEVKASFITSFINYTYWPNESSMPDRQPIQICIVGEDPYTEIFGFFPKEGIRNHPLKSKHLSNVSSLEQFYDCNVLVVRLNDKKKTQRIIDLISKYPILTISEFRNYSQQKTMINLSLRNEKIVFSVNRDASSNAGIVLSSHLLKSARKVIWSGQ
jgi:hypothetical protein